MIAAAIMHGSLNGTGALSIMVITGGNDLTVGITGLAGLIVLAIVDLYIRLRSLLGQRAYYLTIVTMIGS